MDRSFVERNDASREHLERTVAGLTPAALRRSADGGWTVAVLLAHLAYWDRFVAARWRHAARTGLGTPLAIPDEATDLINEAASAGWAAVSPERAPDLARVAADEVDELVRGLPDDVVAAVLSEGRPRLLDRSLHRTEHLDSIDGIGLRS